MYRNSAGLQKYAAVPIMPLGGVRRRGLEGIWVNHFGKWMRAMRLKFDQVHQTDLFVHAELYIKAKKIV